MLMRRSVVRIRVVPILGVSSLDFGPLVRRAAYFFGSISSRRAHTLSFVSYNSGVAPAEKPNGTGPNHVVTGSGPIAAIASSV